MCARRRQSGSRLRKSIWPLNVATHEAVVKRFRELSSVALSAEAQTVAYVTQLVPDQIERFRKLLTK